MAPSGQRTHLDHAAIFDAAPSPYLVVDEDLVIVEVNRAYCDIVGRPRDEMVGRALFEVFPTNPADPGGDGMRNVRASMQRARETGRPDTMAVQKYDIELPGTSEFVERYWSPINIPIVSVAR
jgi:PAS domain S-box-containing protein